MLPRSDAPWGRCRFLRRRYTLDQGSDRVVVPGKLGEGNTVVLPEAHWSRGFKGLSGLAPAPGRGNELTPAGDAGRTIELTDHVVAALDVGPKDTVCICQADGKYLLKSLVRRELVSEMPGWIVLDEFRPTRVVR